MSTSPCACSCPSQVLNRSHPQSATRVPSRVGGVPTYYRRFLALWSCFLRRSHPAPNPESHLGTTTATQSPSRLHTPDTPDVSRTARSDRPAHVRTGR